MAPPDDLIGTALAGRYTITDRIGEGGMGAVFRATQQPLGRTVAVKVLSDRLGQDAVARERFIREARTLSRLSHPNIVVLHDFGETDDGGLFLVMEEVRGHTLRTVMQEAGALPWERACRLCWGVARGLAAAHGEGIVHADLKPENIMVIQPQGEPEQVKLLDFGLARLRQEEGNTLTQDGTIVGTPRYLSPEQIQGTRDNPQSDLYALGVMLFEMLAGRPPYDGDTAAMLLVQHMSAAAPRVVEATGAVPTELDAMVHQLMAKQPTERPAGAAAVFEGLSELLRATGIDDGPSGPHRPAGLASTAGDSMELSWPPRVAGAPTGEVTLVFTDIQGSSALWDKAPAVMRDALGQHDELMRAALSTHDGYEVKTQGDAFMVAFASPDLAVAWALDVQRRLLDAPWPDALLAHDSAAELRDDDGTLLMRGLRVRMGIYTGNPDCRPDPNTGRMDYYGPDVNRAARVEAAAQGGQVFLGGPLAEGEPDAIAGRIGGHAIDPMGEHRLKGISEPVTIASLKAGPLLARSFPPLVTQLDRASTNIQDEDPTFLGRDADMARLSEALERARLCTLLGPGGTGKTRLATRYGKERHDQGELAGGVWLADLTEAISAPGFVTSVARALGVALQSSSIDMAAEQLGNVLAARGQAVLILDNFEQVVEPGAPVVARWLEMAPALLVLATSRIPLGLSTEQRLELGPLDLDAGVALFEVRAGRSLSDEERADTRLLVEKLDGMPLAIELAAARAGVLSPRQILERLDQRLDLLREGRRDRSDRQTTLRGALDWSWDLLDEDERSAFRQCGAFAGGFSLEAAEAILKTDSATIDLLQALRDKSLLRGVTSKDDRGALRFSMYETIRAYAVEQLDAAPEEQSAVFERHAEWFVDRGTRWMTEVDGPRPGENLDRLSLEQENLLAVMARFAEDDPARATRAGMCLDRLADARAPLETRLTNLDRILGLAETSGDDRLQAEALLRRGIVGTLNGDPELAMDDLEEVREIAEELDDGPMALLALSYAARCETRRLDHAKTEALLERARPLFAKHKRSRAAAVYLGASALHALRNGEFDSGADLARKAARVARRLGDRPLEARLMGNAGIFVGLSGQLEEGQHLFERASAIWEELGNAPMLAMMRGNLGVNALARGELDEAEGLLHSATEGHVASGNRLLWASDAVVLATVKVERGDLEEAKRLLDEAEAALDERTAVGRELSILNGTRVFVAYQQGDFEAGDRAAAAGLTWYHALHQPIILSFAEDIFKTARLLSDPNASPDDKRAAWQALEPRKGEAVHVLTSCFRVLERLADEQGLR